MALDAQFSHFFVVVFAVEDLPLLRALEDDFALGGIFLAGGGVDAGFFGEQVFKSFAGFLANGVAIFHEADFVDVGEGVGDGVSQLIELIAADSHSTALYFFASSVLTFLNISWYWAPDLRISSEYASRMTRTSS